MTRLTLRIDLDTGERLGPGKVRLLELIQGKGSIAAAARAMGMSYRRAWLLVDSLNRMFREPVVVSRTGGAEGGGACLTPFGREIVRLYREMENEAGCLLGSRLRALESRLAPAAASQAALSGPAPGPRS